MNWRDEYDEPAVRRPRPYRGDWRGRAVDDAPPDDECDGECGGCRVRCRRTVLVGKQKPPPPDCKSGTGGNNATNQDAPGINGQNAANARSRPVPGSSAYGSRSDQRCGPCRYQLGSGLL